ncbi:MAG: HAMP domain-containing histidine kinase [Tannerellaceae bacterium]|jgi:signal transduction histidine kinase|nr:HAMP domain-containing histidine kinase [Tannerellaceae bacterium]
MKRYTIFLKVLILALLSFVTAFLTVKAFFFTAVIGGLLIIFLSVSLYRDQQKTFYRMEHMIARIRYGDMNLSFPSTAKGVEKSLVLAMNEALSVFRSRLYHAVIAEAESEAWQKLIRVLTHEIMNSVAPIISLSEVISERAEQHGMNRQDYEIMVQSIQTIHRRSKGLLNFVENYRKLARIPDPSPTPFLVADLLRDIQALYSPGGYPVIYTVTPPHLYLNADRALIEQVLINLLKNAGEALSAHSSPEVRIHAFLHESIPVITVTDHGCGILPEALDKIFVPFYTTKPGGSGIGLSICRQIIQRHGGKITVTSETEKGTTFTLWFSHPEAIH